MNSSIVQIIMAIVSSNAVFGFIQFIFNRIDYVKKIESRLGYIDQGLIRMQLLVLISNYPDRVFVNFTAIIILHRYSNDTLMTKS